MADLIFNEDPISNLVTDDPNPDSRSSYKILGTIGHWNDDNKGLIYEAQKLNSTDLEDIFYAVKIASRDAESVLYTNLLEEIENNRSVRKWVLPHVRSFYDGKHQDGEVLVVLLVNGKNISSMRSFIHSTLKNGGRLQEKYVSFILKKVLRSLEKIHAAELLHKNINAQCIFYRKSRGEIYLSFGSSTFQRSHQPNNTAGWVMDRFQFGYLAIESTKPTEPYTVESDIYMIGVLAIELAYGLMRVQDISEWLAVITFIQQVRVLPSSWEQLVNLAKRGSTTIDLQGVQKLSNDFAHMVVSCLSANKSDRPVMSKLRKFKFIKKACSRNSFMSFIDRPGLQALDFGPTYSTWSKESVPTRIQLRSLVNRSDATDIDLTAAVDSVLETYTRLNELKLDAAKRDSYYILTGTWLKITERASLFMGGFRASEIYKIVVTELGDEEPEKCGSEVVKAAQENARINEDALSLRMDNVVAGVLSQKIGPIGLEDASDYVHHSVQELLKEADTLRMVALETALASLRPAQQARVLLYFEDYMARRRKLKSLLGFEEFMPRRGKLKFLTGFGVTR